MRVYILGLGGGKKNSLAQMHNKKMGNTAEAHLQYTSTQIFRDGKEKKRKRKHKPNNSNFTFSTAGQIKDDTF